MLDRKIEDHFHKYKILDTVIIDGRIYDIAKSGFLEGVLLILISYYMSYNHIADSGDSLKQCGRRA